MECLRVVPDPVALVAQAAQLDMGASMVLADTLNTIERQGRERTQRARITLAEFCKAENIVYADAPPAPDGVSAAWREKLAADEFDCIIGQARFHDLVVLAGGAERTGRLPADALGSIVVSAGRPVILAPEKPRKEPVKTIAVAWKDSPEAARALTAAMPLLAKAERIEVLSANEEDREAKSCLDCSESVVRQLRWHGLNAHGHFVIPAGRSVPNAILDTAHGFNADLLVMGGYGHSRMREFVFGGFTQRILNGADLPVFLFH
jgi:nucleotide-binding universal stress UspA family protein